MKIPNIIIYTPTWLYELESEQCATVYRQSQSGSVSNAWIPGLLPAIVGCFHQQVHAFDALIN